MKSPANKTARGKNIGRPLEYTKEMGDHICELIASQACGLLKLCRLHPELPAKDTINRWRYRLPEFRCQYAMAKIEQADMLAEECLEIADDDSNDIKVDEDGNKTFNSEFAARSRLRIDTRKWLASKLLPKQYGPSVDDKNNITDKKIVEMLIDKLVE